MQMHTKDLSNDSSQDNKVKQQKNKTLQASPEMDSSSNKFDFFSNSFDDSYPSSLSLQIWTENSLFDYESHESHEQENEGQDEDLSQNQNIIYPESNINIQIESFDRSDNSQIQNAIETEEVKDQRTNSTDSESMKQPLSKKADNNFPILFAGYLNKHIKRVKKLSEINSCTLSEFNSIMSSNKKSSNLNSRSGRYLNHQKLTFLFQNSNLHCFLKDFVENHFLHYLSASKSKFRDYYHQKFFPLILESLQQKKWI